MKKRSYLIAAGCTVVLYALSACSDHAANDTAQAGNPETMSVAEARRYFERVAAPTRAGSEEGTLTLGTYMPDWSLATVSAGEVLSSTDVPVRGEFRYFRYRIDEYGEPRFTPIYHKLVVVKDSRSGVMSSYLRFMFPIRTMLRVARPTTTTGCSTAAPRGISPGWRFTPRSTDFRFMRFVMPEEHARLKRSFTISRGHRRKILPAWAKCWMA